MIALPFAGIEIIKGQFTDAIAYAVRRLITLPEKIKLKQQTVLFLFFTKEVMNIYEYSANLSGSISYSFFLQPQERTRKYKNKQSMSHTMGIGTGIRLSANNGQQISLHFKISRLYAFPTKSIAWNDFITSIPFSLALIASTYDQDESSFSYLIILPP